MIGSPVDSGPVGVGRHPDATGPAVRSAGSAHVYRWWRIAVDIGGTTEVRPALVGGSHGAEWSAPLTVAPCIGNGHEGHCSCGLHAPSAALSEARGLASLVAGGEIRVVARGTGDYRPAAVLEIAGPLRVYAWCEGMQDGLVLQNCGGRPKWVVAPSGIAATFCSQHFRRLPRGIRAHHRRMTGFAKWLVAGLGDRYEVEVVVGGRENSGVAVRRRPATTAANRRL